MAGHNKWAQIKRKKEVTDKKRGKLFSLLAKMIAMESKKSKGDLNSPGLRSAIEKAKKANVPNDNIDRAVKKGAGGDATQMEELVLEAYGPGGIAIIIDAVTDNRNRTVREIKHVLSLHGGTLGSPGSAIWAFSKNDEGRVANSTMEVPDVDAEGLQNLLGELDDHDDVETITTNAQE